jgi:hypothetical protein
VILPEVVVAAGAGVSAQEVRVVIVVMLRAAAPANTSRLFICCILRAQISSL